MFQNNKNITQQFIIEEILRCKADPIYYIKEYLYILHPIKGIIKLDLYDFQKDCIVKFVKNRFVIVLKSRQIGLSTIVCAYALWLCSFHNSKTVLILANKGEVATELISKCKTFIKYVPDWLKPKLIVENRQSLEFANGSRIKATNTTEDAGRTFAISLLICDEAAMIKTIGETWSAVRPTLATGGAAIILSTPKGVGNWFHKMWVKAETGLSDDGVVSFSPIKLPWWVHPERNQQWADNELADLGQVKFAQEYACDFSKSGNTVVDFETLDWYEKDSRLIKEPIAKEGFDRNLWIWKNPEQDKNYIISGDVARGDGSDFCAAHVICLEDYEQVAEYKGKISPDIFAYLLMSLGKKYNNALIACENNSIGWATIQKMLDENYPKLYYSQKMGGVEFINNSDWDKDVNGRIPGFSTTPRTRPLLINVFEESLRKRAFMMHSQRLLDEAKVLIYNEKGKPEALEGYNDDLIMSCAIGMYVRNTSMKLGTITQTSINMMISNIESHSITSEVLASLALNNFNEKVNPYFDKKHNIDYRYLLWDKQ